MSLWEIYKSKRLGIRTDSLLASLLGRKIGVPYEWVTEKAPYSLRTSANGADIAPSCIDKLVGGSIVWNQRLAQDVSLSANKCTKSYDSTTKITTFTPTQYNSDSVGGYKSNTLTVGHKYYGSADFYADYDGYARIGSSYGRSVGGNRDIAISAEEWTNLKAVFQCVTGDASTSVMFYLACSTSGWTKGTFKVKNPVIIDLTQMFGSTIADYVFTLEQTTAGAGLAWLKKHGFCIKPYYANAANRLMSVNVSSHVMRDADNNVIGNYELDETLTLCGIPKLDANNNLYYDGDVYESDGTVTRKYGIRAYQSGDATDGSTMITDGTNTVYKLTAPTTETAEAFTNPQRVSKGGTEEYVDYAASQGNRDVSIPVGHETEYKMFYSE